MTIEDYNPNINRPPTNRAIILKNTNCAYCGVDLNSLSLTKEHVIGRRFVPKGKLDKQWNLILNACSSCNNIKSDLEDDLSAITMPPDGYGQHSVNDPALFTQAKKKAQRSKSRRTNKFIADSKEQITVDFDVSPSVNMKIFFSSPPQASPERIYRLAEFHLKGFFYLITYNNKSNKGGFWNGQFSPVMYSNRADWGNPVQMAFMRTIKDWPLRIHAIGAGEFFKISIRRHPSADCWGWALEWNQSYRVIGLFGDPEATELVLDTFPALSFSGLPSNDAEIPVYRIRQEVPLNESDDLLFKWHDPQQA